MILPPLVFPAITFASKSNQSVDVCNHVLSLREIHSVQKIADYGKWTAVDLSLGCRSVFIARTLQIMAGGLGLTRV